MAQLRWNGKVKSQLELDTNVAHIWSSATLYDEDVIQKRKDWFAEFLKNRALSGDDLIDFHTNTQKKDVQNGLIINRNQTLLTKNVTQCVIENNGFTLTHYDLITNEKTFVTAGFR